MKNEMDWLIEWRAHLDVLVDVPGSLFATVNQCKSSVSVMVVFEKLRIKYTLRKKRFILYISIY